MNITNLALNKYIQIKAMKDPQCLIDDCYNIARGEVFSLIKMATKIYEGKTVPTQEVELYIINPFIFVIAKDTEMIIDITLIDLKLNPEFTDTYIAENLKELSDLVETIKRVTLENEEKDIVNNQKVQEKDIEIATIRDQLRVLENERAKYLSNIQFNKNEIRSLTNSYKDIVREFTGVDVL